MRCDEVVRELAAPTADRDREAMTRHLAACPACAEWARRGECLDRIWEATRPAEPSPEAWDAVWAQIAPSLPCPAAARPEGAPAAGVAPSRNGSGPRIFAHPAPAPLSEPAPAPAPIGGRTGGRPWRAVAAMAVVGLAQAAAILVALGLAWQTDPRPGGPRRDGGPDIARHPTPAAPAPIRVATPLRMETEIPTSSWIMIVAEGPAARMVDRTPPEMNTGSDLGLVFFNFMEGIATPQVAAR